MGAEQYVYAEGDTDWFATFLARAEKTAHGMNGIILTEYTTSVVCAVAAGSVVEIDGAVFHFSAETAVTGAVATGINYIILSVTGTEAAPYWSQDTFSTYDTAKAGLYTGASRYVAECHYGIDGTKYNSKYVYPERTRDLKRKLPIGAWDMDATAVAVIAHGLTYTNIRDVSTVIISDSASAYTFMIRPYDYAANTQIGLTRYRIDAIRGTGNLVIERAPAAEGYYDNANFDTSTGNRGFVTIWYEI